LFLVAYLRHGLKVNLREFCKNSLQIDAAKNAAEKIEEVKSVKCGFKRGKLPA
jgi:hypothetical protein